MQTNVHISNLNNLENFAIDIAHKLKMGDIVLLSGRLGSGKTTLVKYILKNLNVNKIVTSPTFTLLKRYQTSIGVAKHLDLYRLSSYDEIYEYGLIDEINDSNALIFIEWNKIDDFPQANRVIKINIECDNGERNIIVEGLDG